MSARILDGKAVAAALRADIRARIAQRAEHGERAPGLAVILLGDNPASRVYVANKRKACEDTGIRSRAYDLPATTTQQELLGLIDELNADAAIDGILVQLRAAGAHRQRGRDRAHPPRQGRGRLPPYNIGRLAVRLPLLRRVPRAES